MSRASPRDLFDLVDWRRRVAELYRNPDRDGVAEFRRRRDQLMREHPQSPIPPKDRGTFVGLSYFPADPSYRVACSVEPPQSHEEIVIETGGPDGNIRYKRAALLRFDLRQTPCALTLFSLLGYGGGLFLPFRDATSGHQSYGGGRYLVDTIKNHLPVPVQQVGGDLVELDFNYSYNPSCAYDPRWACPLSPRENWLPVAIEAGEKAYPEAQISL